MNNYIERALVSFSGPCPLNCKHCYTLDNDNPSNGDDYSEVEKIVNSISSSSFDIIYVSHDRENFMDEEAGFHLVERLFQTYHKSILIITRKLLNQTTISKLGDLNKLMSKEDKELYIAVSIPANSSYSITENEDLIATPSERYDLLARIHNEGIKSILMARPIFPNKFVPTTEITSSIAKYHNSIDAVVASGLAVNEAILERLQLNADSFKFLPGNNQEFLIGSSAKNIKYIDVTDELSAIEQTCKEYNIVFSTHSMNALNILCQKN